MNAFDYIDELKNTISQSTDGEERIFKKDAYQMMLNMLTMLETELQSVEYNYEIESIKGEIVTFGDFVVTQNKIGENVLLVQPVPMGEEITSTDLESLREILEKVYKAGKIKENILILPPDIQFFRAVLAK